MYDRVIEEWKRYALARRVDPISPPVKEIINYLANLFSEGKSYNSLCMIRSVLSSLICINGEMYVLGNLPRVRRFMKWVF